MIHTQELEQRAWLAIATMGRIGKTRPAPGTLGSAAALLPAVGLVMAGGWVLELATVLACILGVKAANVYEAYSGKKDASEIVIDELAGQWIALLVVPFDWRWWVAAFILFRLFDVTKPGPVKMAEGLPGGIGVMADDIVAGVLAAVCLIILQWGVGLGMNGAMG